MDFLRKAAINYDGSQQIRDFINAACSGPALQSLTLRLAMLGFKHSVTAPHLVQPPGPCFEIGSMATFWTSTTISKLTLEHVAMSGTDLERLTAKLPPRPQTLKLFGIQLTHERYAKAITKLRDKTKGMSTTEADKIQLGSLEGGEFGSGPRGPEGLQEFRQQSAALTKRVREYLLSDKDLPNPLHGVKR